MNEYVFSLDLASDYAQLHSLAIHSSDHAEDLGEHALTQAHELLELMFETGTPGPFLPKDHFAKTSRVTLIGENLAVVAGWVPTTIGGELVSPKLRGISPELANGSLAITVTVSREVGSVRLAGPVVAVNNGV